MLPTEEVWSLRNSILKQLKTSESSIQVKKIKNVIKKNRSETLKVNPAINEVKINQ